MILLKDKIIRQKPPFYPQIHRVPLPIPIIQFQKYGTLEWDLIFINGMNFLTSQIRKITNNSIEGTKSRGNKTILRVLKSAIEQYKKGFKVIGHKNNNEFKCL